MKLNRALVVACLSFAAILSVTSCKKSSTNQLVGTWKLNQTGTDLNGNGMMDAGEMVNLDSLGLGATVMFTFNSNGTGSERIIYTGFLDSSTSFKWITSNGNKDLTISDQSGNSKLLHINTISSTDLVLADTANPIYWLVFKKQ